mmetsp:Transcript_23586/g.93510  ORF Transcript_23586/g.93510 Transcript_23586/m.93510 type:complete len:220 (+) Transcript_23586:2198-2857(+)
MYLKKSWAVAPARMPIFWRWLTERSHKYSSMMKPRTAPMTKPTRNSRGVPRSAASGPPTSANGSPRSGSARSSSSGDPADTEASGPPCHWSASRVARASSSRICCCSRDTPRFANRAERPGVWWCGVRAGGASDARGNRWIVVTPPGNTPSLYEETRSSARMIRPAQMRRCRLAGTPKAASTASMSPETRPPAGYDTSLVVDLVTSSTRTVVRPASSGA